MRHVVGERFLATDARRRTAAAGPTGGILYAVIGYEERMPQAYAAADLVLARAGASTVAELAAIGVPVDPRAVAGRRRRPPDRQRP